MKISFVYPNRVTKRNQLTFFASQIVMSNPAPPAARPMEMRSIAFASSGKSLILC